MGFQIPWISRNGGSKQGSWNSQMPHFCCTAVYCVVYPASVGSFPVVVSSKMEAGIADHVRSISKLVGLLDIKECLKPSHEMAGSLSSGSSLARTIRRNSGFAPYRALVTLEVGQQAELNLHLSVQQEQHKIDVQDTRAAAGVNTVSSVVDGVINSTQIGTLPLNGRTLLELALLMPGNSPAP